MKCRLITFVAARFSLAVFSFLSSAYCLLTYIPFTRHTLLEWNLAGWLSNFAKYHALLYWVVFGFVCSTLVRDLRSRATRRLAAGFIVVLGLGGVALATHPLLPNLPHDERAFFWSLILLFPLLWIVAIDCKSGCLSIGWTRKAPPLSGAALPAAFLAILYAGIFYLRYVRTGIAHFSAIELTIMFAWSLTYNLLLLTLIFAILAFIQRLSARLGDPNVAGFLLRNLLAGVLAMIVLRQVVLASVFFTGQFADLFAVSFPLVIVAFISVSVLRFRNATSSENQSHSGAEQIGSARPSLMANSAFALFLALPLTSAFAYAVPAKLATADWNSFLQKLSVFLTWTATLIIFSKLKSKGIVRQPSIALLVLIGAVSVCSYNLLEASRPRLNALLVDRKIDLNVLIDQYADLDISFSTARGLLSAVGTDSFRRRHYDSFYEYLRRNTNLPPEIKVKPVEVNLVDELKPSPGRKPHIFLFVIDSLRPDYLSPYNRSVHFTPMIDKFARESVVMENAFTRYGGTALSEAAIWTGGMQLHKQFIEPFRPMNSLEKLVETEGYESFVTVDPILRSILGLSSALFELDRGQSWMHYDFATTLQEIEAQLDRRQNEDPPVFVYTQPQNIHVVTLKMNAKNSLTPIEKPEGFDDQHVLEINRIDQNFGKFIDYLKTRNIYDNSVVILTSDHGDSLGEEGHWGHHTLFPEVVRIPLMVHLPSNLQKRLTWDTNKIAFSTDITPSLFYLLGHRPISQNHLFGRPLFTLSKEEQALDPQGTFLIANSYEPVWGILSKNGRSLFIADAMNQTDYLYEFDDWHKATRRTITERIRAQNHQLIADAIAEINRFYAHIAAGEPPAQPEP